MTDFGGRFPARYRGYPLPCRCGGVYRGAISSIAFGIPVPGVDGNVLRVGGPHHRGQRGYFEARDQRADARRPARRHARDFPGALNQALMELGALVCLPNGAPLCSRCPAAPFCTALREERISSLPVKTPKPPRRVEERTVFLILHGGKVALRRRPARGLLAGLWEYPNETGSDTGVLEQWGISPLSLEHGGAGKHIFTHIEWHMSGLLVRAADDTLPDGWVWAAPWELEEIYAVPNAFRAFDGLVRAGSAEDRKFWLWS